MAGLPLPSIQTVTGKVQRSQSSVLANMYLEDTQRSHGVSDMHGQFNLITGNPVSGCESAIIILHKGEKRVKNTI